MKRLVMLSACLAISLAGWAQGNRNDSLRMDSIIHSLPDVMVKGNRPIVMTFPDFSRHFFTL
mgnify:CR=1 FL=1